MQSRPLEAKVALITGGTGGIGQAICRALARDGASIAINYVSNEKAARQLSEELSGVTNVISAQGDVARAANVRRIVSTVEERLGPVQILVNNAGWTQPQSFLQTSEADWDRMLEVHLKGAFLLAQAVAPGMIERRSGSIINISSVVARTGAMMAGVHYCAAKAGLLGLTRALANQLARHNVRVNAVAPGMIDTSMIRWRTEEQLQADIATIPLQRVGHPNEVAEAVRFLASEASGYITGETVDINGGQFML